MDICVKYHFTIIWYILFLCMCTVCWSTWPAAGGRAAGSAEEAERSGGWAGQILRVSEGCPGEAGASREKSNRCKWWELMPAVELLQTDCNIETTLTYCTQSSDIWSLTQITQVSYCWLQMQLLWNVSYITTQTVELVYCKVENLVLAPRVLNMHRLFIFTQIQQNNLTDLFTRTQVGPNNSRDI